MVVVGNKIDLAEELLENASTQLYISSKASDNIKALEEVLLKEVGLNENLGDYSHVTTLRHAEALRRIDNAIIDIENGFEMGISSELIIMDIKLALEAMGEITGEVTNDEILGSIFSKFCIGK
jgi:tRNA modification GTPase